MVHWSTQAASSSPAAAPLETLAHAAHKNVSEEDSGGRNDPASSSEELGPEPPSSRLNKRCSSATSEADDKVRRDLRRERNREHARISRERKRRKVEHLTEENDVLQRERLAALDECCRLRDMLARSEHENARLRQWIDQVRYGRDDYQQATTNAQASSKSQSQPSNAQHYVPPPASAQLPNSYASYPPPSPYVVPPVTAESSRRGLPPPNGAI